jgi:hypothetical protein
MPTFARQSDETAVQVRMQPSGNGWDLEGADLRRWRPMGSHHYEGEPHWHRHRIAMVLHEPSYVARGQVSPLRGMYGEGRLAI